MSQHEQTATLIRCRTMPVVEVFVLSWSDADLDLARPTVAAVADYVAGAVVAGLSAEEIAEDLLARFADSFDEAEVDVAAETAVVTLAPLAPGGLA